MTNNPRFLVKYQKGNLIWLKKPYLKCHKKSEKNMREEKNMNMRQNWKEEKIKKEK